MPAKKNKVVDITPVELPAKGIQPEVILKKDSQLKKDRLFLVDGLTYTHQELSDQARDAEKYCRKTGRLTPGAERTTFILMKADELANAAKVAKKSDQLNKEGRPIDQDKNINEFFNQQ